MKTFIDTSPFIYLVENHPEFADQVRTFILDAVSNNEGLVTSVITLMEYGVMPEKKGRQELILQFEEFLQLMNISVETIDKSIAETAYKLPPGTGRGVCRGVRN